MEPKLESVLADWPQIAAVRADVAELPALAGRFHALAAPVAYCLPKGMRWAGGEIHLYG